MEDGEGIHMELILEQEILRRLMFDLWKIV
jgi:hypothetical protein